MLTFRILQKQVEDRCMGCIRPTAILMAPAAFAWFEDSFSYAYGSHMKPTQFMGIPVGKMGDMASHGRRWLIAFEGGWSTFDAGEISTILDRLEHP